MATASLPPRPITSDGSNGRRSEPRDLLRWNIPFVSCRPSMTNGLAASRGRIVYETLAQRFVIYADRRLQVPGTIDALKTAFGLGDASVIVKSDLHYR